MRAHLHPTHLAGLLLWGLAACGPSRAPVATGGGDGGGPDVGADLPVSCQPPLTECDGKCVDLSSDRENCGSCGFRCWGYVPGQTPPLIACEDGICAASFRDVSCVTLDYTASCAELCAGYGAEPTRVCVENGCDGATMLWQAGYKNCDVPVGALCPDYQEPMSTVCQGIPEHDRMPLYQQVACDVPLPEAFAQSGLPPTPPELTEGPYAGWIPEWWGACCCKRLPKN